MKDPNYKNYSFEELVNVLSRIDKEKFPDRVKKIQDEIISRAPHFDLESREVSDDNLDVGENWKDNLTSGLALIAYGVVTLLSGSLYLRYSKISFSDVPELLIFIVIGLFIAGLFRLIIAEIQWENKK